VQKKHSDWGELPFSEATRRVSAAVDLSRIHHDEVAEIQLADVLLTGREADLLEAIRHSQKDVSVPLELLRLQASRVGIPPLVFEKFTLPRLRHSCLEITDDGTVSLRFTETERVYSYVTKCLREIEQNPDTEKQIRYLDVLAESMAKPIALEVFYEALSRFDKPYRKPLQDFMVENKLLIPFQWRNEGYVVSHRLYKDEKRFKAALEILESQGLAQVLEFLNQNPGNPSPVVGKHLGLPGGAISALSRLGILEPIRLTVEGDSKEYLFTPAITASRPDKDQFDPVKMTLANFRFGEYYSKKTRLRSLDEFLSSLLDRGYAGWAEAIGTDYRNLEAIGVVKVVPVSGGKYRFWLMKRDVITDVRSIVRGAIPIQSDQDIGDLTSVDNLILSRRQISLSRVKEKEMQKKLFQAIRDIQAASLG
jgi:hypothetical protein